MLEQQFHNEKGASSSEKKNISLKHYIPTNNISKSVKQAKKIYREISVEFIDQ